MKNRMMKTLTLGALVAAMAVPSMAMADDHRNSQRDTWKGLTIGSTLIGLAGLASGNKDVAVVGAIGAAYSAYRLSGDRRDCDRGYVYVRPVVREVDRHRDWDRGHDRHR